MHDFAGRSVLLVFTQSGCSPCKTIVPELNRLDRGDTQVLVVNNGTPELTRKWSADVGARFPVLAQEKFSISKQYETFATPFAFLINAKGVIVAKGIIHNRQHIHYVLSGAHHSGPETLTTEVRSGSNGYDIANPDGSTEGESAGRPLLSPSEEMTHA